MPKVMKILFVVKDSLIYSSLKLNQFFAISSIEQFNKFIELI